MPILLALAAAAAAPGSAPAPVPACAPRDVAVTTDARDGDFNGMSHSGTYLVVRNRGGHACTLPGLPRVTLRDARGRAIPAVRQAPAGMHPGPMVRPVTLAPGDARATGLRWVSGPVYDRNRCYDAASVAMAVGGGSAAGRLAGHLCGEAGKPVTFEQQVLGPLPG